ncbi:MAG: ASKHA domain-containing protein [Desulfobacterales bacterium]
MQDEQTGWTVTLNLPTPSLDDNRADADRLKAALASAFNADAVDIDLSLLKKLPARLRKWGYRVRCLCFNDYGRLRLVGIKAASDSAPFYGLAVDLGTTRVVFRLINLDTGEAMAEQAFDNPQIEIGPDILERIHYADTEGGLEKLNQLIIKGFQENMDVICRKADIRKQDIYLLAVAGNTSMGHLFMGLYPGGIIREPYIPVVNRPGLIAAQSLGIDIHPEACVFIFPNVGSYFGGDLISGILYSELHERDEIAMLVDVGTNAEVVLGNRDWLVACAGAAGPALEGGVSRIGMTAGPGVIDEIRIDPETLAFDVHTIDDQPPKGICGTGMIDLVAQLFLAGLLDIRGRLVPDAHPERIYKTDDERRLVIVNAQQSATGEALTLGQADFDSLIRSKAAMYTILETITGYVGVTFNDISRFYVAGTFGSFIRPRSAITIGMIPDLPEDTYQPLGNSSLGGAARLLKDQTAMTSAQRIYQNITYLELNVNQEFMNRFSAAKFLPHTEADHFPSVKRGI